MIIMIKLKQVAVIKKTMKQLRVVKIKIMLVKVIMNSIE